MNKTNNFFSPQTILISLLLFIIPALCFPANDDLQYRNKVIIEKKINDKVSFSFANELRFHDFIDRLFTQLYDVDIVYKVVPHLALGFTYRARVKKKDDGWKASNEPMVNIINQWQLKFLKFYLRNRILYNQSDDAWFYRIKPKVTVPIKKIKPYIANEFFLRNFHSFQLDRLEAGVGFPVYGIISMQIAGLFEYKKDETGWFHDANILQITTKFSF